MIRFDEVTKSYPSKLGKQVVFTDLSFTIPAGRNIALLGSNGAGKSTLFKLLAGSEFPDTGKVHYSANVSWPISLANGVHPRMTGRENARFIGRVHGVDNLEIYQKQVQRFARLGRKFDLPVKNYSSGMRAKLAFACCLMIPFDLYLLDEITSVGDAKFRQRARRAIKRRVASNVLMISHSLREVREFCDCALVLDSGAIKFYDDLEEAISQYQML